MTRHSLRHWLVVAIKIAIAAMIMTWLLRQAISDKVYDELRESTKDWSLLFMSFVVILSSVVISIVRWMVLVRALGLPFTLGDSLRLGFLGFLFNQISLGSVGGDLFKAAFIAREHPGKRTEAVSTVIADRVLGLYALVIVACFFTSYDNNEMVSRIPGAEYIVQVLWACAAIGAAGIVFLFIPAATGPRATEAVSRLPIVGNTATRLLNAARDYRNRPISLAMALFFSVVSQAGLVVGIYMIAKGLGRPAPTLAEHFLIVPLTMVAGALPITPAGIGAQEGALAYLYDHITQGRVNEAWGLVVALGYRLITVLIAGIGAVYYLTARRSVAQIAEEAKEMEAEAEA